MSRLTTIMQTIGMPAFERVMGDPAVYETPAGESKNTWAIIGKASSEIGEFGERVEFIDTAELPRADVPQPLSGATLAVGAKTYRVGALLSADDLFVVIAIKEIP